MEMINLLYECFLQITLTVLVDMNSLDANGQQENPLDVNICVLLRQRNRYCFITSLFQLLIRGLGIDHAKLMIRVGDIAGIFGSGKVW